MIAGCRFTGRLAALAVWALTLPAPAEPVPSVYSHFNLLPRETAEQGLALETGGTIASLHVIRPIAQLGNPAELLAEDWAENREAARKMRENFRRLAEAEYRRHGVLEGPLPPRIEWDLDRLLDGNTAIVAVTEPGHPDHLLQMISVNYDEPLPLEVRLRGIFPGVERGPHTFQASPVRFIEAYGNFFEVPLYSLLISSRPAVDGDTIELKTFIRGTQSHRDWVPLILRTLVSLDLLRTGVTPLTDAERALRPGPMPEDEREALIDELTPYLRGERRDRIRDRIEHYRSQPAFQKTVRVSSIRIEAIGDALNRLYTESYGFLPTGYSGPDPDVAGETVHVLQQSRSDLEDFILDKMDTRRGIALVNDYGPLPAPSNVETSWADAACLTDFSQLGSHMPPVLGTRGARFPFTL